MLAWYAGSRLTRNRRATADSRLRLRVLLRLYIYKGSWMFVAAEVAPYPLASPGERVEFDQDGMCDITVRSESSIGASTDANGTMVELQSKFLQICEIHGP